MLKEYMLLARINDNDGLDKISYLPLNLPIILLKLFTPSEK